ncbi:MAG: hypothetical protein RLZZ38_837 [Bacteroidota bacterium]
MYQKYRNIMSDYVTLVTMPKEGNKLALNILRQETCANLITKISALFKKP